jgi:L-histidine N-alpha-methyltransferase
MSEVRIQTAGEVEGVAAPLPDEEAAREFAEAVAEGLARRPRELPYHFLYDAEGSRIFDEITRVPEYYPTRTEAAILAEHARELPALTGLVSLVELGSGYSVKTKHLLDAYTEHAPDLRYVPIDVSRDALEEAGRTISAAYPRLRIEGIEATYDDALELLPRQTPQMVVFLGSSIGNLDERKAGAFWESVARNLPAGDFFLLGVDLVKDPRVLVEAYDDPGGVTARFTKNYITRLNRELGAGIDIDAVEHVATWNAEAERIEIRLRFTAEQEVLLAPAKRRYTLAAGEEVLIEISRKYRVEALSAQLERYGLSTRRVLTDERDWFALLLLERTA